MVSLGDNAIKKDIIILHSSPLKPLMDTHPENDVYLSLTSERKQTFHDLGAHE